MTARGANGADARIYRSIKTDRAMPRSARPSVIVTGAANGIGRAIGRHLLAHGWDLIAVDLPKSGLSRTFRNGRHCNALEGDIAAEATATRAVEAALDRFGRLDALVSNAGIMIRKPIRRLTLTEWHR